MAPSMCPTDKARASWSWSSALFAKACGSSAATSSRSGCTSGENTDSAAAAGAVSGGKATHHMDRTPAIPSPGRMRAPSQDWPRRTSRERMSQTSRPSGPSKLSWKTTPPVSWPWQLHLGRRSRCDRIALQQCLEDRADAGVEPVEGEALEEALAALVPHRCAQAWLLNQRRQAIGDRRRVPDGNKVTGHAVLNEIRHAALFRRHHREGRAHRLEDHQRETLLEAWEDEDIGLRHDLHLLFPIFRTEVADRVAHPGLHDQGLEA